MTDSFVAVSFDGSASKAVTITITGTNDVPVITGEDTGDRDVQEDVDASASGTLTIADVDDGESEFTAQPAGSATYGSYVLNADGTWTYTLDDTNGTVQALSAGETMTDSFVAVSEDGTASATVTITITGTNDVPVISGEATGDRSVTEESDLAASGTLTIADVDDGELVRCGCGHDELRQLHAGDGWFVDVHAGERERHRPGALGWRDDDGLVRGGVGGPSTGEHGGDDHDHGHERRAGDQWRGDGRP
ncbi:MAG: hypothetical protein IPM13_16955 [Phycisphaerales bacterium]|nr:hypothetical protein [Phycisphaerales bacterium]